MFYPNQKIEDKRNYIESLKIIGSLSNLFSDSHTPYLYYRIAEKLFCKSFGADDLSRGDVALDAFKGTMGIGLKTFLASNDKTFQKVAEFNKDREIYQDLSAIKIIKEVSKLRNKRIEFTQNLYGIEDCIYHCVVREKHRFKIFEEKMDFIDIENISDVIKKNNIIKFNDNLHEYSFNISKSTLTKRFVTTSVIDEFDVKILLDPLTDIRKCLSKNTIFDTKTEIKETIYLPLYGKNKTVYPRSGLNQWNAKGRKRDEDEVYIPVPIAVHKKHPDFFPKREIPFNLKLPNKKILKVKLCQSSSKALMSYSNKELGKWILRDVLNLKHSELLTYDKLQEIGVDSVRIDKLDDLLYEINFSSIGSYEEYIQS
jgi:hypothetical protein